MSEIEKEETKPLTEADLFAQHSRDEQFRIKSLPWETDPQEAQKLFGERHRLLEAIRLEATTRLVEIYKKGRALDAAKGNRWDKGRGKENSSNLSDPRNSPLLSKAQKEHKAILTKVEKAVSAFIETGNYSDDEIMDMFPEGKFKGHEVRAAILKMKG